ncbi:MULTISPECIES: IS3 family transposase [Tetragenococcus]|uniref:IS3 family transposase n=1 Tax=Tetragenococcus TaxID=51668 RepID=UPI001E5B0F5F|nr:MULTISPECIES: IS3 family transposase [Tetragenococcus]MDN6599045.1 IS3 family transposase [Tetragenococcus koreensis]MDN5831462.1 IS3 family transposase [Tetragenococcus halophilus]MDN6113163.1 IS3 family transposase [Tetragenococcus halophilus]MDN6504722.1 IS3 family transposase [Tetragenococcus halophilus]MDN6848165.1 IS3 family transposase [Tetragenococcus koreensis]
MRELHEEKHYPVQPMCKMMNVTRSAYNRWVKQPYSPRKHKNEQLTKIIRKIHDEHPEMGYRRIKDELKRNYETEVNDKRVLRLCRKEGIQSTIKHQANSITRRGKHPYHTAKNILNRSFTAEAPNQKWVTDISEFKYYIGLEVHKVYLSAILDLCDRRIVSFVIRETNDLPLVIDTFDQAVQAEPEARPIFHSDRGFQYTHQQMYQRITEAGMTQSMSRVGKCTDNGPMEGFWGIIKREKYYGRKFTSREQLVGMINDYINYYNNGRYQRKLQALTPMECHNQYDQAV